MGRKKEVTTDEKKAIAEKLKKYLEQIARKGSARVTKNNASLGYAGRVHTRKRAQA